ncbi:MAG TPA: diacylglycerol kinase family protein [Flavisolibacter sp.]|nr:diacylglycerol kinase family protein [Flavisolibacter sp.]
MKKQVENPGAIKTDVFSWKARMRSFIYAGQGIVEFFGTCHNARIHLAAAAVSLSMGLLLHISRIETIVIIFSIAFVWVAEMVNTALEKAMDFISLDRHPAIRAVKDLAAGSVLVAALAAASAGLIIFIPKISNLLS